MRAVRLLLVIMVSRTESELCVTAGDRTDTAAEREYAMYEPEVFELTCDANDTLHERVLTPTEAAEYAEWERLCAEAEARGEVGDDYQ